VSQDLSQVQAANSHKYPESVVQAQAMMADKPMQIYASVEEQAAAAHADKAQVDKTLAEMAELEAAAAAPDAADAAAAATTPKPDPKGKGKGKARAQPTAMMCAPVASSSNPLPRRPCLAAASASTSYHNNNNNNNNAPLGKRKRQLTNAEMVARDRNQQIKLGNFTPDTALRGINLKAPVEKVHAGMSPEEQMKTSERNQCVAEVDARYKRQKNNEAAARSRRMKKELIDSQATRIQELEAQVAAQAAEIAAKDAELARLQLGSAM
jgi:hypothetical protein